MEANVSEKHAFFNPEDGETTLLQNVAFYQQTHVAI
jgi:hypothetical protein